MKVNRKTQEVAEKCSAFNQYGKISLANLIAELTALHEHGYVSVELFGDENLGICANIYRMETELEQKVRIAKEEKAYAKFSKKEKITTERKKARLLKEALKLGLKLAE